MGIKRGGIICPRVKDKKNVSRYVIAIDGHQ